MPNLIDWSTKQLDLLGTAPDHDIAKVFGVSPPSVSRKRTELGIPPFARAGTPIDWTAEKLALLGTAPDGDVAEQLGISKWSVLGKRTELGVPAYRKGA
jgi:hypothetical protein